uniref:Ethanolaminephosphotransferase 1 n=1 Tax=Nothoprocta perdicaria TaxID=30464 RepID=A0A8C6YYW3_NOTPE
MLCFTCLLLSSQYSAVDTNPLSVYVMQPLWDKIIKIVPLWIAPNVLTFSGFVMVLVNYFLLTFYDWDYTASGKYPRVVIFQNYRAAYVIDLNDNGKQARRTQSSSPLGELFDHGLDSWATSIFVLSFFSVCSRDNGKTGVSVYTMYLYLSIVLFNFLCSHWEKYNTGVLFLPWGYDLSQVLIAAYLLTGAVGVEVWHRPFLFGYYITDVLTGYVFLLHKIIVFIYRARLKKTLKIGSLYEGLLPLVSPLLLFILLTVWVVLSPGNILAKQPRLFLWMVGVAFSNVVCRVIVCQMSGSRAAPLHAFLAPLAIVVCGAATAALPGAAEEAALALLALGATAAHLHYGVCVVSGCLVGSGARTALPAFTLFLRPLPSPCSFTLFLCPLPSPCSFTLFLRPLPLSSSFTLFLRPLPSPSSFALFLRPLPSPCSFALFLCPLPSPCSFTLFLHSLPSSCSFTLFLYPVPLPYSFTLFLSPVLSPCSFILFLCPVPSP